MVRILHEATFSGIQLTASFCVNEYIAKIYTTIICNIFSDRFDNTADFEISIFNLTHKIPQIRHLKYENDFAKHFQNFIDDTLI